MLLNFTDPSERRVLQDPAGAQPAEFGTVTVEGIRLMAAARRADRWAQWPSAAPFTWPTWEAPRWRARTRPVFDSMRETFRTMATPVTRDDR